MVFRDDRDALLAQASALRTQLEKAEADLEEARRVAADAKAAGMDEDDADEARLKKEIERLREEVSSLKEAEPVSAPSLPSRAEKPAPVLADAPIVFGSTIRGPTPDLPPAGNPAMAIVALLMILAVVAAFAFLALS